MGQRCREDEVAAKEMRMKWNEDEKVMVIGQNKTDSMLEIK